jgi:hypothetical protein
MLSRPTEDVDEAASERTRDNDRIVFGLSDDAPEMSRAAGSIKKTSHAPPAKTAAAKPVVEDLEDSDSSSEDSNDTASQIDAAIREDDLERQRDREAFVGKKDEDDDETRDIFVLDAGIGKKRKKKDEEDSPPPKMLSNLQFLKQKGLLKSNKVQRKESSMNGIPEQLEDEEDEEEEEEEENVEQQEEDAEEVEESKRQFDAAVAAAAKKKEDAEKKAMKTRGGKGRKK